MASPQKENGYTAIANELLEELTKYRFPPKSSLPFRLCLCVIRKTYGYRKKMDIISLSQFQKATREKNRTNLVYWLNFLVQAKILVKIKKSEKAIEYGFNKDYEQWKPLVQVRTLVQARLYGSASNDTNTSASNNTYKRKKEIYTKEKNTAETSSALVSPLIKLFEEVNPATKGYYANKIQRKACQMLIDEYGFDEVSKVIAFLPRSNKIPFVPTITTPLQLWEKYQALKDGLQRKRLELSTKGRGLET